MTITLSLGVLGLIGFSLACFLAVTVFCARSGMFDGSDTFGIGGLFTIIFYCIFWIVPTLVYWGVWATWFKGAPQ